jgi:hypothetical protein
MTARIALALVTLATCADGLAARSARACNACVEDKIAATYDWQVVSQARQRGHTVVFAALVGRVAPSEAGRQAVLRSVRTVREIEPGTTRVSLQPPAISFVFDPHRTRATSVVELLDRALRSQHVVISIVRIGAPGATAPGARGSP